MTFEEVAAAAWERICGADDPPFEAHADRQSLIWQAQTVGNDSTPFAVACREIIHKENADLLADADAAIEQQPEVAARKTSKKKK